MPKTPPFTRPLAPPLKVGASQHDPEGPGGLAGLSGPLGASGVLGALAQGKEFDSLNREELEAVARYCRLLEDELKTAYAIQLIAVEQAPVGIVVADAKDMRIRLASVTGKGILGKADTSAKGVSRLEHMQGWELQRPDGTPYPEAERPLERAIHRGEVSEGVDAIIAAADGEQRHVRINAAPVRSEHGEIIAGVAVFLDVTDQKALEAQRTQTLTFFAHDMKSPLMGAVALTRRLLDGKEGKLSDRQAESLEMIAELQERVFSLSLDFLDVARMGQAGFTLARDPVDMTAVLQALAREYGQRAKDKGLEFELELEAELPEILGDKQRLMRMVGNLMDNAIKYTPKGRVLVRARVIPHAPGKELEIQVLDEGPGLREGDIDNLFEKFFRGSAGKGSEGTGVGLAAVKAIAQAHGGRVAAANALSASSAKPASSSTSNRAGGCASGSAGALFTVWLPLDSSLETSQQAGAPASSPAPNGE